MWSNDGQHRPDPHHLRAMHEMRPPATRKITGELESAKQKGRVISPAV
jgi:hypothetical protein